MKAIVNLFLLLWVTFLATPTIIGMVTDINEVKIAYNMAEEENQNETEQNTFEETHKEFILNTNSQYLGLLGNNLNQLTYEINHNISNPHAEIFSPPPEV